MGASKGGESNNEHLQTLSSQRAAEKVKGNRNSLNFSWCNTIVVGAFPRGREYSGRI